VSQVSHNLSKDISPMGFLSFVVLFLPVWWAWIGATFYANRFDVDDIGNRLLTGVQMLAIAGMAINIHNGLSAGSVGFALSYVAVRVVLVYQYIRAARHLPLARGLASRYALGFAIAALLWFISVFIPTPFRFLLWGVGLIIDFATPLSATKLQVNLFPHTEHLPERFGLFTIIILGEAIIAVVNGVAEQAWEPTSVMAAILGFSIAFSFWWIYFENVGGTALRMAGQNQQVGIFLVWLYGHLPLVIGLAGAGVGVEHVVSADPAVALPDADRWLLCGSVALCLLSLAMLHRLGVIFRCRVRARYRSLFAGILFTLAIAGKGALPIAVIGLVAAVCAIQVAQDLYQGHPKVTPDTADTTSLP
jgi:low temperature requirement protein LtrA